MTVSWEMAKAYFALLMCSDPTPVSEDENALNVAMADELAKHFGFNGWIEAFHSSAAQKATRPGMKLSDALSAGKVWFAKAPGNPMEYRVVGYLDKGQRKFITLEAGQDTFMVEGFAGRDNGWGYAADFAFATSREQWFELVKVSSDALIAGESFDHFHFIRGNRCVREVKA